MPKPRISDELWVFIEPLLPPELPPPPKGGRPRIRNRAALTSIVFVLKSGLPWEILPRAGLRPDLLKVRHPVLLVTLSDLGY